MVESLIDELVIMQDLLDYRREVEEKAIKYIESGEYLLAIEILKTID